MITIQLDSAQYRILPEHETQVREAHAKAAKTRRKPITAGCGRSFPRYGVELSTREYVRQYFELNGPSVYCRGSVLPRQNAENGRVFALEVLNTFEPLSAHVSVVQGVESVEVEA